MCKSYISKLLSSAQLHKQQNKQTNKLSIKKILKQEQKIFLIKKYLTDLQKQTNKQTKTKNLNRTKSTYTTTFSRHSHSN